MDILSFISIISILASATVALFMFVKNRKGLPNIAFLLGMLLIGAIEFADFKTFNDPSNMFLYKKISLIAESLMPGIWLLFSLTYGREGYKEISVFWKGALFISVIPLVLVLSLPFELFLYSPDIEIERIIFLGDAGYFFYLSILIHAVLTMINLEGTLRSSSGAVGWRIKHML